MRRPAIVCGGRDFRWSAEAERWLVLELHRHGADALLHGDSGLRCCNECLFEFRGPGMRCPKCKGPCIPLSGADILAAAAAERRLHLPTKGFPAEWSRFGRRAGPIRNADLAAEASSKGRLPVCLAFPGGSGTRNMVREATNFGIVVVHWR